MSETGDLRSYDLSCPHCKKPFQATLIDGATARHRGFKCPHCRLFVPWERVSGSAQQVTA